MAKSKEAEGLTPNHEVDKRSKFENFLKRHKGKWQIAATASGAVSLLAGGLILYRLSRKRERIELKNIPNQIEGIKGEGPKLSDGSDIIKDIVDKEDALMVLNSLINITQEEPQKHSLQALLAFIKDGPGPKH